MTLLRRFFLPLLLLMLALPAMADSGHVMWSARLLPEDARSGESAQIVVTITIEEEWHTYSLTPIPDANWTTTLKLTPGDALMADGNPVQPAPKKVQDKGFNKVVEEFEHAVAFGLPVKIKAGLTGKQKADVEFSYQVCKEVCLAPKTVHIPVEFTLAPGEARPDHLASVTKIPDQPPGYVVPSNPPDSAPVSAPPSPAGPVTGGNANPAPVKLAGADPYNRGNLFLFLLAAFGAGFLALLTPCVFPMVPITVSFFSKRKEEERGKGIRDAVAYCLGIVGTYTILGLLMTAIFGPFGIQKLAGNVWVNMGLAALFIILAANLFGVYEIAMPTFLLNSAQSGRQKGGFIGPMMMGFAFTLTSFTCTGAFVGTLLASAAQGDWFYPTIGMLAFSTAFASPFFLLALFPQYLAKLPKSGSWLVSVKAFMGFLELAAALKFLSNVDLAWEKGFLTRPVFLGIWACIGIVAGLYLLGWLRLPHDDAKKIGWPRRTLGVVTALLGVYCFAAINGASLGKMDAFVPPAVYPGRSAQAGEADMYLHNYEQALAKAKAENKPLFIDFTGAYCTNCRLMESSVFPDPGVIAELKNYILLQLYTDRPTPDDQKNQKLQEQLAGVPTLPVYVTLSPEGKPTQVFQTPLFDSPAFTAFLKQGRGIAP